MHLLRDTAVRWLAGLRVAKARLNVAPESLTAVRLYARHGAVALNEYLMVWEDIRALLDDQALRGRGCSRGLLFSSTRLQAYAEG